MILSNRSTTDLVVLLLTGLVCTVLVMLIAGAIVGKLLHPDMHMENITEVVTIMVSNITGALLGWMGGKAVGRMEANGK